jgi:hypothetical protein
MAGSYEPSDMMIPKKFLGQLKEDHPLLKNGSAPWNQCCYRTVATAANRFAPACVGPGWQQQPNSL